VKRPAFLITDWLLFNAAVPARVKTVIGYTLAWSGRNPSIGILATRSGMKPHAVIDAQRWIEANLLGEYRRGKRGAENTQTNRLVHLDPAALPQRDHYFECIPRRTLSGLPRGKGVSNTYLYPLLLALYAREQHRRGAVQIEDEAAAAMISLDKRQVQRLRQKLIQTGALVRVRKDTPAHVYRLRDFRAEPDKLDTHRTPRVRQLPLRDQTPPLQVICGPGQQEALYEYASRMKADDMRSAALLAARNIGHNDPSRPLLAAPLIDAVQTVDVATRPTLESRDANRKRHDLRTTEVKQGNPGIPLTVTSSSCGSRRRDQTTAESEPNLGLIARLRAAENGSASSAKSKSVFEARTEGEADGGPPAALPPPWRYLGPEYSNLRYRADDATHEAIQAISSAFEARHGRAEVVGELHTVILGSGQLGVEPSSGDGRVVLERLQRHAHLLRWRERPKSHPDHRRQARSMADDLDGLLANLGIPVP
jgi:hypothetical protein